jgi:hypothetical protein
MRNAYNILVGKPEGSRPFGRSRCRWEDKYLREIGWEDVDWIQLAQWQALVEILMNIWLP